MKRFLNPLPSVPVEMLPRWKDQVDFRYALYVGIVVPLWRKLTKPWRYPFCRWPVRCAEDAK